MKDPSVGRTARHHEQHRTFIDWSHELLAVPEQILLRRLCVFAGGFTLEDVEAVCRSDELAPTQALELMSSLVDKSLVLKEDADRVARYRLHETMRECARVKLEVSGNKDAVESRYTEYYTSRCRRSAGEARYKLLHWLEWIDLEIDNLRTVLRWSLNHQDFQRGIDVATSLGWYWVTRATTEGVRWFDELLAAGDVHPRVKPRAYFIRGFLAILQGDATVARSALHVAIAAAREGAQFTALSQSLAMASIAENMAGDPPAAMQLLHEAEAVTARSGDPAARLGLLQARTFTGFFQGDLDAARSAASEGARLSREVDDLYSLHMMLMNLGIAALIAGDLEESNPLLCEALRIARELDDRVAQYYLLDALGCHAARSSHAPLAAQLFGAAESLRTGAGATVIETLTPHLAQAQEWAVAALGSSGFDAAFEVGRRLSRYAALRLALGESAQVAAATPHAAGTALLSRREAEVAQLVAEGLSNKQIGARLFISEHTVDTHVRSILNKVGVNTGSFGRSSLRMT